MNRPNSSSHLLILAPGVDTRDRALQYRPFRNGATLRDILAEVEKQAADSQFEDERSSFNAYVIYEYYFAGVRISKNRNGILMDIRENMRSAILDCAILGATLVQQNVVDLNEVLQRYCNHHRRWINGIKTSEKCQSNLPVDQAKWRRINNQQELIDVLWQDLLGSEDADLPGIVERYP